MTMNIDTRNNKLLHSGQQITFGNLQTNIQLTTQRPHGLKRKSLLTSDLTSKSKYLMDNVKSGKDISLLKRNTVALSLKNADLKNKALLEVKKAGAKPSLFSDGLRSHNHATQSRKLIGDVKLHTKIITTTPKPSLFQNEILLNSSLTKLSVAGEKHLKDEKVGLESMSSVEGKPAKKKVKVRENSKEMKERHVVDYEPFFKSKANFTEKFLKLPQFQEKVSFDQESDLKAKIKERQNIIASKKLALINLVSVALLQSPELDNPDDGTRRSLMEKLKDMAPIDPEFILKLSLYTRQHLNVRVVANFLLAYGAYNSNTRSYLRKYFRKSVVLPSDWISVAELYQSFFDKSIKTGSLPAALRKVLVEKFPDFDEYQLAKYNKDKKKPSKLVKLPKSLNDDSDAEVTDGDYENADSDITDGSEESMYLELKSFTLKQLIRKLHVFEPVYPVMCLLGKKYPDNQDAFFKSRLPGHWEEEKSGKRMKLPIPQTWETQVSMKGNKAETWQQLIDDNKLPFMAMLRNLRNMIVAGMSEKYHSKIIRRLTDVKSVVNSRQFPFRFLSAFEVLEELEAILNGGATQTVRQVVRGGRGRGRGRGRAKGKEVTKTEIPINTFNKAILKRYKKALDTALKIATIHNVSPICGTTLILCDVDPASSIPNTSRNPRASKRSHLEMQLLLALMCAYHCEDALVILHYIPSDRFHVVDGLDKENILENVKTVKKLAERVWCAQIGENNFKGQIEQFITKQKKFDNCLHVQVTTDYAWQDLFTSMINLYRHEINPSFLYVNVNVSSKGPSQMVGEFDVFVSGFSDQVLRYIAERGSGNQLNFVENIDKYHELDDIKIVDGKLIRPKAMNFVQSIEKPIIKWKTIKVFISSTFRDMHGERDILTRYVFPELRCWCYNYFLNVCEIDLRWGVNEKQMQNSSQLEICLNEVLNADLFIGIIGSRYGWTPESYDVNDTENNYLLNDWLKDLPAGYSITELEMRAFLQKNKSNVASKALFMIRNNDGLNLKDIPKEYRKDFKCESKEKKEKLNQLVSFIDNIDNVPKKRYDCEWEGVFNNKPMVGGLKSFSTHVLHDLWDIIEKNYIDRGTDVPEKISEDDVIQEDVQSVFINQQSQEFIGRRKDLKSLEDLIMSNSETHGDIIAVTGQNGVGKTAFLCSFAQRVSCKSDCYILQKCYFFDAVSGGSTISEMLSYFIHFITETFNILMEEPKEPREFKQAFEQAVKEASKLLSKQLLVFVVDGLEKTQSTKNTSVTDWIPEQIPKNVVLVVSCREKTKLETQLLSHKHLKEHFQLAGLEYSDRSLFVYGQLLPYGKELDESPFNNQMKVAASKKHSHLPSYLKLLCEELRMFGVFEKLNQHLAKLPPKLDLLATSCLDRIEEENGKEFVRKAFVLLGVTRTGLTENELYDLLNMLSQSKHQMDEYIQSSKPLHLIYEEQFNSVVVPRSLFAKMIQMMKMFFVAADITTGCLKIVNEDLQTLINKRYISSLSKSQLQKVHVVLASFFYKQADPLRKNLWNGGDAKALAELPFHMIESGCLWNDFKELLCDMFYIKEKIKCGLLTQLLEDYQFNGKVNNKGSYHKELGTIFNSQIVADTKDFVTEYSHILNTYPFLLEQLLINWPRESCVTKENMVSKNKFKWLNKATSMMKCALTNNGPTKGVTCVAVSQDELKVACGLTDGQLVIFEKQTNKIYANLFGHASSVSSLSFAGSSSKICSSAIDGSIMIWNTDSGQRLHHIKYHKRQVNDIKTTSDGRLMISVAWDNTARLWTISDGKQAGVFQSMTSYPINCIALDQSEKYAALGGWKKQIYVWNILENKKHDIYKGHLSSVRSLCYAKTGSYLVSSSLNGEVILWTTKTGAMLSKLDEGNPSRITSLAFSPDSKHIFGAGVDSTIKVWSGNLGYPSHKYADKVADHDYPISLHAFSTILAVGFNSGMVKLISVSGHTKCTFVASNSPIRSINSVRTTRDLITASEDGIIQRWSIGDYLSAKLTAKMLGHTGAVNCLKAREGIIVSASSDASVRVWPAMLFDDMESCSSDESDDVEIVKNISVLQKHSGIVTCCDISPDETLIISGSIDRSIIIWDMEKALLILPNAHSDSILTCSWSDVGNYVVTGGNDCILKLWDTRYLINEQNNPEKMKEKIRFVGHDASVLDVKYKFGCVASVSSDGIVKVWTHKGVEITSLRPHQMRIHSCEIWAENVSEVNENASEWALSGPETEGIQKKFRLSKPSDLNEVLVFTASEDGSVQSYHPFKPNVVGQMFGHTNAVTGIVAKESHVISCSADKSIKQWEYKFNSTTNEYVHTGGVTCVASYNESLAAVGGRDAKVSIYKDNKFSHVINMNKACAVTAIAWLTDKSLIVGDSEGYIGEVVLSNHKVSSWKCFNSPIQNIALHHGKYGNSPHVIVTAFDGLHVMTYQKKSITHLVSFTQFPYRIRDAMFVSSRSDTILRFMLNGNCYLTDLKRLIQPQSNKADVDEPFDEVVKVKSDVQIQSVCGYENRNDRTVYVATGNKNGSVTIMHCKGASGVHSQQRDVIGSQEFKVHDESVTCITLLEHSPLLLVTASADKTIKIWKFITTPVSNIEQIGLYHCMASVVSLDAKISEENKISIVTGDSIGNTQCLSFQLAW